MSGILGVGAAPLIAAAGIGLAFAVGFVLGIAYGVREEQESQAYQARRCDRDLRTVRVTMDSDFQRAVTRGPST